MPRMARGPEGAAEAERGAGEAEAALEGAAAEADPLLAPDEHDDVVAGNARLIRQQAIEVQDETGAAGGFGGEDGIDPTHAHVDAARRDGQRGVREVERDACRVVDGERDRLSGRRRVTQGQLHLLPGDVLHVDRLELVRRPLRVRSVRGKANDDGCGEPQQCRGGQLTDGDLVHSHLLPGVDLQFKASEAGRSM